VTNVPGKVTGLSDYNPDDISDLEGGSYVNALVARRPTRVFRTVAVLASASTLTLLPLFGIRPAHAADSFVVTSMVDAPWNGTPGACQSTAPGNPCTLRAAIEAANAGSGDSIKVKPGTYVLEQGPLTVSAPMVIDGSATKDVIVDGNHATRPLEVAATGVKIEHLTVRNGAGQAGGAVDNDPGSQLTLDGVRVTGSSGGAGGVYSAGSLTIENALIDTNNALRGGGGVYVEAGSTAVIDHSVLSDNNAVGIRIPAAGGGLLVLGTATVTSSTISRNVADSGGGIAMGYAIGGQIPRSTLKVSGSTIDDNGANAEGGGIANVAGDLTLVDDTVSKNQAGTGGGIVTFDYTPQGGTPLDQSATLEFVTLAGNSATTEADGIYVRSVNAAVLHDTIVANTAAGNCSGPLVSAGYNLDSGTSCGLSGAGDLANTDPTLGPLADNGGPTPTMALLKGSPAIDAADPHCTVKVDQRGVTRPQGPRCDIGAFELEQAAPPTPTPTPTPTGSGTGTSTTPGLPATGLGS
jgi:CSLREA domain-containing protein